VGFAWVICFSFIFHLHRLLLLTSSTIYFTPSWHRFRPSTIRRSRPPACPSTPFTLGLTDWGITTISYNNQQVVTMTSRDTKHGIQQGHFSVYSATTPVNANCMLVSVTLPPASNGQSQLHIFAVGVGGPNDNNTGITDNSNTTPGDFDGPTNGNSYSAEALQAVNLFSNQQFDVDGIAYSWPDASSGTVDNYQADGQIIPVTPVPGATTVGFLGAATNGDSYGQATLNYADGTSSTFTLSLTDWAHSSGDYGNLTAATCSSYNTQSGNKSGNRSVWVAETSITAGETLVSVTLPSTLTGGTMHVFAIGTRGAYNNLGSSNDSAPGEANYGGGYSWSIQALEAAGIGQNQPFIFNGVTFTWPASYSVIPDNYESPDLQAPQGQTLPVTPVPGATTLAFLGAATNSEPQYYATGTATINFTNNGGTQQFTLAFNDWFNDATLQPGEQVAATCSYINSWTGQVPNQTVYVYYFAVTMTPPPGDTIQSVTLPSNPSVGQLHVFAIGTK
jgi:hypothetical protein